LLITLPIDEVAVELLIQSQSTTRRSTVTHKSSNDGITVNILISCSGNCHVTNKSDIARSIYIQIGKVLLLMFCDRVTAALLI
jgi:hypothetical protein